MITKAKILLALLFIVSTLSSFAKEPVIRVYLSDGSIKSYNLKELQNIKFNSAPDTLQLLVIDNTKSYYYPAQLIDSLNFTLDSINPNNNKIHLWHGGFKWNFHTRLLDSILLYYTKYVAVTIGMKHWMYKNLDVDHYRNGDSIPEIIQKDEWIKQTSGAWCNYNNDPDMGKLYGKLYNGYTIEDSRGLAPQGWHLPSVLEWSELISVLAGFDSVGGKLKLTGAKYWKEPNTGATNESGFSLLPAGQREGNGDFWKLTLVANLWANPYNENMTGYYVISWNTSYMASAGNLKRYGFSVRCVKDK